MKTFRFPLREGSSAHLLVNVMQEPMGFFGPVKAPALIHASAGGFMFCLESDTFPLGTRLLGKGFNVICSYMYPVGGDYRFPQVVIDMMKSIRILREHADEWGIDPDKIVISGHSAGAFICMATGNLWNRPDMMEAAGCTGEEGKPNAMVLGYGPMFCGQQTDDGLVYVPNGDLVGEQTPPTFFHHARQDKLVSVYQTISMLDAFEKAQRPYGCYISSVGDHGATGSINRTLNPDGTVGPCMDDWFDCCWRFLQNHLGLEKLPQPAPMMSVAPGADGGDAATPPPMPAFSPMKVPEGSAPVTPADMPLGKPGSLHMPFNIGFWDKDFTVYE